MSESDTRTASGPLGQSAWVSRLQNVDIPVLGRTADELEDWREREDDADAHQLSELVGTDPLMTLKLLATAARLRPASVITQPESVTAVLLHLGIGPFFREFGAQTALEDRLASEPRALDAVVSLLNRARRSARFALGFAVHRLDPDADLIQQAALLHDTVEMLIACEAPTVWRTLHDLQLANPAMRSHDAQQQVLGVDLVSLQQALFRRWRLPPRLCDMLDDHHADSARGRCVALAVQLTRHLQTPAGWRNAALPDDVDAVAALLNMAPGSTLRLLRSLDD